MKKLFFYSVLCQEFGGKQKHFNIKSYDEICYGCDDIILHRLVSLVSRDIDFNPDLISVERLSTKVAKENYGD